MRIVRKVAQYFYPQRQTQVMNEGWATFWHHTLLNTMYDDGYLTDGVMIEWLKSHTNVVYQPPRRRPRLQRHQPLRAGLCDVHRHQAHLRARRPTKTAHWFPDIAGTPWLPALRPRDAQLQGRELRRPVPVSPKLMRELRLFAILDDENDDELEVSAIHDDAGYRRVREALAHQYDLGSREPNIQVWNVNLRGDRSLTLRHTQHNDRPLDDTRAGSAEARGAAVGLRRAAGERQRNGRRDQALEPAGASCLTQPFRTRRSSPDS